jgi:acetolactate synthase I/II/III large subunit
MIKASDYIIKFLELNGIDTAFSVSGGAAAHLMDSVVSSNIKTYHNYHEQACAMAADAYARIANKPALVLVTNGPGSSNTITGVLGAWQDSVPMIILSGQVPTHQTLNSQSVKLRQLGLQEANIVSMVEHCTKYAVQVNNISDIPSILEEAWTMSTSGRMGPVWIDVPIDIQAEPLDESLLRRLDKSVSEKDFNNDITCVVELIGKASKPLFIAGNGIHLSQCEEDFLKLVKSASIPVVATWNATDLFNYKDNLYVGNFGLLGERAANFAIQEADLIISFGSRLSIPCTGYNTKEFAKNAHKVVIDIDANEINKTTLKIDTPIIADLKEFVSKLKLATFKTNCEVWKEHLANLKTKYCIIKEPHTRVEGFINSYDFIEEFSLSLRNNDVIVTDMGSSFTCTMQALRNSGSNRLFTSSALCSMGFGLPGAIGAYAADPSQRVICIAGDGGFQMNIQELQTIVHNNIPIKIIILNNDGYLAISLMQDNLFNKRRFGADRDSGVSAPDFCKLSLAYGIPSAKLNNMQEVKKNLSLLLDKEGPMLIEINMVRDQLMIPRVQSKRDKDGKIISGSLDVMFPFLDQ